MSVASSGSQTLPCAIYVGRSMVAAATRDVFVQQLRDTWDRGEDGAIVFVTVALHVGGDNRDTAYPKISLTPVN